MKIHTSVSVLIRLFLWSVMLIGGAVYAIAEDRYSPLFGSPTFITVMAPLEMLFIIIMVLIFEEREVKRKFGNAYESYRKSVPMVSFRSECLRSLFKKVKKG